MIENFDPSKDLFRIEIPGLGPRLPSTELALSGDDTATNFTANGRTYATLAGLTPQGLANPNTQAATPAVVVQQVDDTEGIGAVPISL
ncbi:MAG: hypothetical protein QNJ16_04585 [Rhodobacter sp.]|nr:hypothetical protein [Rhodobacter sp.]